MKKLAMGLIVGFLVSGCSNSGIQMDEFVEDYFSSFINVEKKDTTCNRNDSDASDSNDQKLTLPDLNKQNPEVTVDKPKDDRKPEPPRMKAPNRPKPSEDSWAYRVKCDWLVPLMECDSEIDINDYSQHIDTSFKTLAFIRMTDDNPEDVFTREFVTEKYCNSYARYEKLGKQSLNKKDIVIRCYEVVNQQNEPPNKFEVIDGGFDKMYKIECKDEIEKRDFASEGSNIDSGSFGCYYDFVQMEKQYNITKIPVQATGSKLTPGGSKHFNRTEVTEFLTHHICKQDMPKKAIVRCEHYPGNKKYYVEGEAEPDEILYIDLNCP